VGLEHSVASHVRTWGLGSRVGCGRSCCTGCFVDYCDDKRDERWKTACMM